MKFTKNAKVELSVIVNINNKNKNSQDEWYHEKGLLADGFQKYKESYQCWKVHNCDFGDI